MFTNVIEALSPEFERIASPETSAERLTVGEIYSEGPVWNAREGALLWSNIFKNAIMQWTPGKGLSTFMEPAGGALGLTYDREGRLVAAGYGTRTVWRLEHDGTRTVLATHYEGKKIQTPNDIVVRSDGSIYWTESTGGLNHAGMFWEHDVQRYLDFRAVFLLSPDGAQMTPVLEMRGPNGLALSPDESLLYVADTGRRHIEVFDVQPDGTVKNGRIFYKDTLPYPKNPDGMKVDVEGNVYCTGSGGVHVIDPDGNLLGRIKLVSSNIAWGDEDWKTLYICSRMGTGDIFRVRLNIPGIPV